MMSGCYKQRQPGDTTVYCVRVRSIDQRTWDAAQHIQTDQGLASVVY